MLVLQFSGVLSAGTADNAGAYKLASVIKVKASGKGKNRKPATNKLGSPVPVASAVYSASDDEVILAPRTKLTASKPGELIVNGTLITDTLGREIDGADDGVAGSDYVATISGTRRDAWRAAHGADTGTGGQCPRRRRHFTGSRRTGRDCPLAPSSPRRVALRGRA